MLYQAALVVRVTRSFSAPAYELEASPAPPTVPPLKASFSTAIWASICDCGMSPFATPEPLLMTWKYTVT